MDTLSIIAQFFLCLSILVVLHEGGHYVAARLTGTRVERFYLFFDFLFPFPDKMKFSLWKKKIGDTEYGVGWFPMGGYVSIAGMQDETQDAPDKDYVPAPDEYGAKSKFQKLFIMLGGVIVNFILGFLLYGMVLWIWGEEKLPMDNATSGIYVDSLGEEMGLKDGDKILSIGGEKFAYLDRGMLKRQLALKGHNDIKVLRDGKEVIVSVPKEAKEKILTYKSRKMNLIGPRMPFVIDSVMADSPAKKANLQKNDRIVSVNDTTAMFFSDFAKKAKNYKGKTIKIGYEREGIDSTLYTQIELTDKGKMGVQTKNSKEFYDFQKIDYSLGAALPAGFNKGMDFIKDQFAAFRMMFTGDLKVTESLGGFGSIGGLFNPEWNWRAFWSITAMLSLILAIMNLLPIPMLDGGYVLFLLIEMITGREIPENIMNVAMNIGFYIIIALMLFSNGMDVMRWLGLA